MNDPGTEQETPDWKNVGDDNTPSIRLNPGEKAWRRFKHDRVAVGSFIFLVAVTALVLVWPVLGWRAIAHHLPQAMTWSPLALTDSQFAPPGREHWFGTDVHGRDLLSRVFYGARISLLVGVVGAGVSLVIGVLWGAIAGYVGGRWDNAMMRFVDILYSLPSIVFVIVLIAVLEESFKNWLTRALSTVQAFIRGKSGMAVSFSSDATAVAGMILLFAGLGAVSWLTMARIVRGQVLSLRARAFVDASRALGASHTRILLKHILPNIYGVIIVYLTLTVPSIILYESFLSYLGLGIQPPQASLGCLIADGAAAINPIRIYWWVIVFPGVTLASTLLALNFLGDGLRDALDPRATNE